MIHYLEQNRTTILSSSPSNSTHTVKIPDPELLSDGQSPTFEQWKTKIEGKFAVNQDQFVNERARMVYLYNRTTGDAQAHLQPRFGDDVKDPFPNAQEMMKHLSAVYIDPYKVENA